jgi:hypothetical protein
MNANEVEILYVEESAEMPSRASALLEQHHLAHKLTHVRDRAQALDFLFATGPVAGRGMESGARSPRCASTEGCAGSS